MHNLMILNYKSVFTQLCKLESIALIGQLCRMCLNQRENISNGNEFDLSSNVKMSVRHLHTPFHFLSVYCLMYHYITYCIHPRGEKKKKNQILFYFCSQENFTCNINYTDPLRTRLFYVCNLFKYYARLFI